jgi:hypothetical protein
MAALLIAPHELPHHVVEVEARRLLARRIIPERLEERAHVVVGGYEQQDLIDQPGAKRARASTRRGVGRVFQRFISPRASEWP